MKPPFLTSRLVVLWSVLCLLQACGGCEDEQPPAGADMTRPDAGAPDLPIADMADMGPVDPPDMPPPPDMGPPADMTVPPWDFGTPEDMGQARPFALEQVVPPSGPVQGDTLIRLRGQQLTEGVRLLVGDVEVPVRRTNDALTARTPAASFPGPVTVKAISPAGEVSALPGGFTYLDALALTAVSPSRVPTRGGVWVTLDGQGFDARTAVSFGGAGAEQIEVVSPQQLRALAPPHPRGFVDVRVTSPLGVATRDGGLEYVEPLALRIVDPSSGPLAGGTRVTLTGEGITSRTRARFGGREAEVIQADAATGTMLVSAPAGASAGLVDITLLDDRTDARLDGAFEYLSGAQQPGLTAARPGAGSTAGGTEVVVTGFGFDRPGATVRFGDAQATIIEAHATWARVQTPAASAPGVVDVVLRDNTGELGRLTGGFEYAQALWIDAVQPARGSVDGGQQVTLTGEGFTGLERLMFGGVGAMFEVRSDTELLVTVPPHAAGVVDVRAERGAAQGTLRDGYTFEAPLQVWGMTPTRGSIAGGTQVALRGQGFVGALEVFVDGVAATQVRRTDGNNLTFMTPPHARGEADVVVRAGPSQAEAPYPFLYFNPINRFGGASGERIEGAVNVSVFTQDGVAIPYAFVMLSTRADTRHQGVTDEAGMVTLSGPDVYGAQTITATAPGFSATTVQTIDAENVTIFLNITELPPPPPPSDGNGNGGGTPPTPAATISGNISAVGKLSDPSKLTTYDMAIVGTTSASNAGYTPNPGDGSVVLGEGRYTINTRIGDMAVVGLCGVFDEDTQTFDPQYLAVERFVFVSDQQQLEIDLVCDIPLNRALTTKLVNPIFNPSGPNLNRAQVVWDFGFEGTLRPESLAEGLGNILTIPRQPAPEGVLADLTFNITGGSYTTNLYSPLTQASLDGVTSLDQIVALPPLLDVPEPVSPTVGGVVQGREISWEYAGPYLPDLFVITIRNSVGLPVWQIFVEGDQTSVRLPDFPDFSALPADLQPNPYPADQLYLTINAARMVDRGWTFERFTYEDLAQSRWEAFSTNRWGMSFP